VQLKPAPKDIAKEEKTGSDMASSKSQIRKNLGKLPIHPLDPGTASEAYNQRWTVPKMVKIDINTISHSKRRNTVLRSFIS
jgi:hypothetical protein